MSGVTSATAPVILARRSSFSGKVGKYTLSLANPHKRNLMGLNWEIEVAVISDPLGLHTDLENVCRDTCAPLHETRRRAIFLEKYAPS
jgi:hypothetical protein